ncbi:MAG: hypothetical protein HC923_02180 [Myxococcales bacterium]|nr:hypothetical protein [Myxococcales bacterium]
MTRIVDPLGLEVHMAYDERGNRVEASASWAGSSETWEYDAFGQVVRHVHAEDEHGARQVDERTYAKGYLYEEVIARPASRRRP